ncbi:MAG: hypothetical protein Q8L21_00765 [Candidatus Komeilibacteria bacterium]|nr:hypothetical protein [Candidatus Komeilibacteria bacterium]
MVKKEPINEQIFVLIFLFVFALGFGFVTKAQEGGSCSAKPVNSSTLIKTYRMRDRADGYGLLAAKDGGYLLTGDTVWSSGMGVWYAFAVKTDAKGNALWSRQLGSKNATQGVLSETKRPIVQTTDNNFIMAADIIDFYDAKYEDKKELWGDVLVTKLNTKGNVVWSTLVGDYSMDFPQKLWATSDGGVLLLAKLKQIVGISQDQEIGDSGAVPDYSVVIKFDKNGKTQWSKKMNWVATDMKYLPDGSFIALAAIDTRVTEQPNLGTDVVMGTLPAVIRLDKNLNVLWAKSIETPAMEQNMATITPSGAPEFYKVKMRISGGDFRAVEQAPDGGFIAFGRYFSATQLLSGNSSVNSLIESIPFVAVKISPEGEYQWAKSLKTFNGAMSVDFKVAKTNDNEFVLMRNITRQASFTSLADMAGNLEFTRVDADFNPRWIKKINIEQDITGSDIQATKDGGVAASGRIITTAKHMIMGSLEPWEETVLIKADVNGNVSGAKTVATLAQAALEDQSSYLIMQPMIVKVSSFNLPINKKVTAKVSNIKDLVRTNTAYKSSKVTPSCSYLTDASSSPAGQSSASPTAKTWSQISFESAKEVAAIGEKNQPVNEELLPILKAVYGDKVKLKDSLPGMWLTYIFTRPTTRADVEVIQKKYEEKGYKITSSEGGDLWVSKIGLTLHLEFSIQNSMAGKLEVLF